MTVLLGITRTGWQAFRQQRIFTVHFIRKNPSRALCRVLVPYREKFTVLPKNAVLCDRCRSSAASNGQPAVGSGYTPPTPPPEET